MSEPRLPSIPDLSATRRTLVGGAGASLTAAALLGAQSGCATATGAEAAPLYDRLGGAFAIAAVVDHFSDAVVRNPIVGQTSQNAALREWHTRNLTRLPGLKFMRTLWVCNVSGGPFQYTPTRPGSTNLGLEEAHRDLRISPAEFDEVAAELALWFTSTNSWARLPRTRTAGYRAAAGRWFRHDFNVPELVGVVFSPIRSLRIWRAFSRRVHRARANLNSTATLSLQ